MKHSSLMGHLKQLREVALTKSNLIGSIFLGMLVSQLPVKGQEGLHFFDLLVEPIFDGIEVKGEPRLLVTRQQMESQDYSFSKFMKNTFDAPITELVGGLLVMEENRQKIFPGSSGSGRKKKPIPVAAFAFDVSIRVISGRPVDREKYEVEVLFSSIPGRALLVSDKTSVAVDIQSLRNLEGYQRFLVQLVFPKGGLSFKTPDSDEFLIDLYFTCSARNNNIVKKYDLPKGLFSRSLATLQLYGHRRHLGTTYGRIYRGKWDFVHSGHLHFYRDTIEAYARILEKKQHGEEVLADLEVYTQRVPADFMALGLLLDTYLEKNLNDKAFRLIGDYKPMFHNKPRFLEAYAMLEEDYEKRRRTLLNQRGKFGKNEKVKIEITSPKPNDFIGGETTVHFELTGHQARILQIDAMIDDRVVGSISDPPFRIPFHVPLDHARASLKVAAYFEDGSYQAEGIRVKTLYIDKRGQVEVRLVTLRVIAARGVNEFLLNLTPGDFAIYESKRHCPIRGFTRDKAPLRVAVLIDTSSSMAGEKLYRAQYAVNRFLSKLGSKDRASIYTFDQTVLKLSDFTNHYESIQPVLLTLSPHHSTSLNNALIVAHQDLLKQQGTQVIIVLSDGQDSGSALSTDIVYQTLKHSKVMVYSVVINLENQQNKDGNLFMRNISKMTGSSMMKIERIQALDKSFDQIYNELRSFYLIDFYSKQHEFIPERLRVKVKRAGVQTRFKQH